MRRDGRRFGGGRWENGDGTTRTERLPIPEKAIRYFLGTRGRNVKELTHHEGIRRVDVQGGEVVVIGTTQGIAAAERRVNQAISIANFGHRGYFPEHAVTVVDADRRATFNLKRVGGDFTGLIDLAQFDPHRQYYSLCVGALGRYDVVDALSDHLSGFAMDDDSKCDRLCVGYDARAMLRFFKIAGFANASDTNNNDDTVMSLSINFGKTLFSSVPDASSSRSFTATELETIFPRGRKDGAMRPEFNRLFKTSSKKLLVHRVVDRGMTDYTELEIKKLIRVECWLDDDTKRRYSIVLVDNDTADDAGDDGRKARDTAAIRRIAEATTYFDVLGIGSTGAVTNRDVNIAYRKTSQQVHPDKNAHPSAVDAMKVVNEARETLKDAAAREMYRRRPAVDQKPTIRVHLDTTTKYRPLPTVKSCRSPQRKLALFTVLRDQAEAEFRSTMEIETNFGKRANRETLYALERAWENRTSDDRLSFPNGTTFKVDTTRYVTATTLTNGTFELTIADASEEWFGKATNGVSFHLESYAINALLATNIHHKPHPDLTQLLRHIRDLHDEARRLADLLRGDSS